MSQDDSTSLPNSVSELQTLLLQSREEAAAYKMEAAAAQRDVAVRQQTIVELSATIDSQKKQLEKNKVTIEELMAALRGKTRERIDPDQLLLFDQGELEALIREQADEEDGTAQDDDAADTKQKRKKKRGHGRGFIPENLPREEVLHELPEEQRLCPIDNKPMPVIRWETSEQLEYVPSQLKVLVHKRAVYACPEKHDEATLMIAPKPPQPIDKGLPGPGRHSAVCWSCRSFAVPSGSSYQPAVPVR